MRYPNWRFKHEENEFESTHSYQVCTIIISKHKKFKLKNKMLTDYCGIINLSVNNLGKNTISKEDQSVELMRINERRTGPIE